MAINIDTIPITKLIKERLMNKIFIYDIESRDMEADRAMKKLADYLSEIAYNKLYE